MKVGLEPSDCEGEGAVEARSVKAIEARVELMDARAEAMVARLALIVDKFEFMMAVGLPW